MSGTKALAPRGQNNLVGGDDLFADLKLLGPDEVGV